MAKEEAGMIRGDVDPKRDEMEENCKTVQIVPTCCWNGLREGLGYTSVPLRFCSHFFALLVFMAESYYPSCHC